MLAHDSTPLQGGRFWKLEVGGSRLERRPPTRSLLEKWKLLIRGELECELLEPVSLLGLEACAPAAGGEELHMTEMPVVADAGRRDMMFGALHRDVSSFG